MNDIANRVALEPLVDKWQPRLRLADWIVTIRYAHQHEFRSGTSEAEVSWATQLKRARILIIEPAEYFDGKGFSQDIEESVVHELIHLHFAVIDDTSGLQETMLEQAIECLAVALVNLDRNILSWGPSAISL